MNKLNTALLITAMAQAITPVGAIELNEKCVINILNRTVQVQENGNWALPNVPSNMGQIRARATCMLDDGSLAFGQSEYFSVTRDGISRAGDIRFTALDPIPTRLSYSSNEPLNLSGNSPSYQVTVTAYYADDQVQDVTAAETGINYSSSNPLIASVSSEGLISGHTNGSVLISARKDGVLVSRRVTVFIGGDQDGDGIPDDWERANGLNPNDPVDAVEDQDKDGLTAKQEFELGTNIHDPDSDGDGISDLEETILGDDGVITSPVLADTDGDGISDGLEIAGGSDPNDSNSGELSDFLESISVQPANLLLTYNQIDGETSQQLQVIGTMIDASTLDLTAQSTGTRYSTSDMRIANFGLNDGQVFAGENGNATVTVRNNDKQFVVNVTVNEFTPQAQSALTLPGYANNVDMQGDYVYVASGSAGLQVIDVSNPSAPKIIGSLATGGVAVDVKVLGNYAYLADGLMGLQVIDIANPAAPVLVSNANTGGFAMDIALKDELAYVADGKVGFEVFNIADPQSVFSVGEYSELTDVSGIAVEADWLVAVAGSALALFDISATPTLLHIVNIGDLRDVAIHQGYVYVAAKNVGYRVYKITEDQRLSLVGGDRSFVPYDVTVSDGFAFYADLLFNNVIAVLNVKQPDTPVFQDIIDFFEYGDYAGTGISVNATHAYMTAESVSISNDYGAIGDTKLFGAQYRDIQDINGIAPQINLTQPASQAVVVEGKRMILAAQATDDIAVAKVEFFVNGNLVGEDTSAPYRIPMIVPLGINAMAIRAVATDLGNQSTPSAMVTLQVQKDDDQDGLGNEEEIERYLTKPKDADSDEDGLLDGEEIARGTDPNSADSDGDGLKDKFEIENGTDPNNPDTKAPQIISTDPSQNSSGVAENTAIIIQFNEQLQRKSIDNDSVIVIDSNETKVAGTVRIIGDGSQLAFQPTELLSQLTSQTVTVSDQVKDSAGNPLGQTYTFSFETGDTVDTEQPTVVDVAPHHNGVDIPVNVRIMVRMSERLNRDTVNSDSFYITDTTTNTRIDGFVELEDDDQSISFRPNQAFLVGRRHAINIKNGITDLSGNALKHNYTYYFTTAFAGDGIAPSIVKTSFANGQQDVPLNATMRIKMSEMINPYTIKNIFLLQDGVEVASSISLEEAGTLIKVEPQNVLTPTTAYSLLVDGLEDLSGNLLAQPLMLDFVTAELSDTNSSSIKYFSPRQHAQVADNIILTADYAEVVDFTSVNNNSFKVYNSTESRYVSGDYGISEDGQTITFEADSLQIGHKYWVYLSYLYDLAGNRFNSSGYHYFSVEAGPDQQAPSVEISNIIDGATDIALNSAIHLRFAEPVGSQCVDNDQIKLLVGDDNDSVEVDTQVTVSSDGLLVTITPVDGMTANSNYQVVVDGVCDYAGNILSAFQQTFTTGTTQDTTKPSLVSITPAHNTTDVAVNSNIVLTFDETLDPTNSLEQIRISVVGMTGYVAGDFVFDDNQVIFTPDNPLPGNSRINIYLYNVRDVAGNRACCWSYDFYTESVFDQQGPQVVAITPADGAMDIGVNTPVVIRFNESLNGSTVNNTHFKLYHDGNLITPSVTRSLDNRTVTLRGTWPAGQPISVLVTNQVKDLSNNPMLDFASGFATAAVDNDNSRPSVVRQYPISGATNVTNLDRISLFTNEAMLNASVMDAFHVAENGILVPGDLRLEAAGQAITFTPSRAFTPGALIHVYLDSSALDDSGNPVNHYQGHFTMATDSQPGLRPSPLTYIPADDAINVAINTNIQIAFNQDLDPNFINQTYINLRQDGGDIVSADLQLSPDGRIVTISPTSDLQPDTYYYVSLSWQIQDVDGDVQYHNRSFNFTTSSAELPDNQQPMVMAMSPGSSSPQGAINVPLNPLYHVNYDEPINPLSIATEQSMSVALSADNQTLTYFRFAALAANTTYNESPVAVADLAGNPAVAHSETFTTGNDVDVVQPNYTSHSPAANQTVAINTPVVWRMNEVIDPLTISPDSVYVLDTYDHNSRVPGTISLGTDGSTITWVSDQPLLVGRRYRAYLLGVTDLSGNSNSHDAFYFYTNTAMDTQPPSVVATTVADGMADVALNSRIRVRFDEIINTQQLTGITLSYNGQTHPVRYELSADKTVVILVPISLLPAQTEITLTISGIRDLNDNLVTSTSMSFTTEVSIDTQGKSLVSFSPTQHALVASNTRLSAVYAERVDPVTVTDDTFKVYNQTQRRYVNGHHTISDDGTTIHFYVEGEYSLGDKYWAYLSHIYDTAGNRLTSSGYHYFTVVAEPDHNVPLLTNSNIPAGMTAVALNSPVVLQFDEPLAAQCVNHDTLQLMLDGVAVAATLELNDSRTQITLIPDAELEANASYQVVMNGLCDMSGNTVTNTTQSFTTGATSDTTKASLISITPAHNATEVAVNSKIVLTFDETIDPTNSPEQIRISVVGMTGYVAGDFAFADNQVIFTPDNPLPGNSRINIYLYNVRDVAGNRACCWSYDFYTESVFDTQGPQVVSITPADGSMDIGVNIPVVITFNESLNASTVNNSNFKLYHDGDIITPSVTRSLDNRTVTLRGTWPAGAPLTVFVTDQVKDLSNNPMQNYISYFSTAIVDTDNVRPSVVRQYPVSGATDVRNISSLTLYTNEAMDISSIHDGFTLVENGVIKTGELAMTANGQGITFTPDEMFAEGSLVHVYLSNAAHDDSGNPVNAYQGNFTMGYAAKAGIRPSPLTYVPADDSTNVAVNTSIQIAYNQDLDPEFINQNYINLRIDGGELVASTLSLSSDQRIVTITPQTHLMPDTYYYVSMAWQLQDINGDTQYHNRSFNFTTADSSTPDTQQPMVVAMSPSEGAIDVPLNPLYHVSFDEAINPLSVVVEGQDAQGVSLTFSADNQSLTYLKHQPLTANTVYSELSPQAADLAGNPLVSHAQQFTTGEDADITVPNYVTHSPAVNQKVAPNTPVVWSMSEVIDHLTVNDTTVYVQDTYADYQRVAGKVSLGTDGKTITWISDEALLVGRRYRAYLLGVTDLSGNVNSGDVFYFYTELAQDTIAPKVLNTSITQGMTDIPLNTRLRVRFDERIDKLRLADITLSYQGQIHPISTLVSADGSEVTIIPASLLPAQTQITLQIAGVTDLSGNSMPSMALSFSTGSGIDTQAGGVVSFSPTQHAEVPTNLILTAIFTERVDYTSVNSSSFKIYNATQQRYLNGTYHLADDGKTLSFDVDDEYSLGDSYWAYLSHIRDLAGNRFNSSGYHYFKTIATQDTAEPLFMNGNIPDGMQNVPLNAPIQLIFNEPLAMQCVNHSSVKLIQSGNEVAINIQINSNRTQLTLEPDTELIADVSYQVVVDGLCDVSGNILNQFTTSFITGSAIDTTKPTLLSITPAHNTTEVGVNAPIVMTFNEAIDPTNSIEQFRVTVVGTTGYVAGDFGFDGNTVIFTPSNPWPGNSQINVYLNHYRDIAGNSACCWSYNFYTESVMDTSAPQLVAISPADGAMDIGVNTPVVLNFNESLNGNTVNNSNFKLYAGGNLIHPAVSRSLDGRSVTLRGTWPAGQLVNVLINDQITDLSNNPMSHTIKLFTTAPLDSDNHRPSVVRQYPASGATHVLNATKINLFFNDNMQISSFANAFKVAENGVLKSGSVSLTANGQGLTYTPDTPFAQGSLVHVYVNSQARDDSGNPAHAYQGHFTTGYTSTVGVRPSQITYVPANGAENVVVNTQIQIGYNQPLNEAFINQDHIQLKRVDESLVAAQYSLSSDQKVVSIRPNVPLLPSNTYKVSMSHLIEDIDGETQYHNRSFSFNTSDLDDVDTQEPTVVAMSPVNGSTQVALNPQYRVEYDESFNPLSIQTTNDMTVWLSNGNRQLRYQRHQPLPSHAEHTEVAIAVTDLAGNAALNHTTSFSTGEVLDTTAPNYQSYLPKYNSSVATNTQVYWQMTEVINPLSINPDTVYVKNVSVSGHPKLAGSASLSNDGRTITWTADQSLPASSRLRAYVSGVTDDSGNLNAQDSFYFYTNTDNDEAAPQITAMSIDEGATDVAIDERIVVTFDETVNHQQLSSIGSITLSSGGISQMIRLEYNSDFTQVTVIGLNVLPPNQTALLTLVGVRDLSGNVMANQSLTFTTGEQRR